MPDDPPTTETRGPAPHRHAQQPSSKPSSEPSSKPFSEPSLELARQPHNGAHEEGLDEASERERIKKRKPIVYKKPKTFSWAMVGLAAVGAISIFAYIVRSMKDSAPKLMQAAMEFDLEAFLEKERPVYQPVGVIEDGVLVEIDVEPRDARIFLDGMVVQSNPIRIARGTEARELIIWDVGYQAKKTQFVPAENQTLTIRLEPEGEP